MTTPTEKLAAELHECIGDDPWLTCNVPKMLVKQAIALLRSQQPGQDERKPADFAIEHGEYLARRAETMIERVNALAEAELRREESDDDDGDVDDARGEVTEAMRSLRNGVYEFRKRAERAKAARLSAPQAAGQWMPIETAPEFGEFLVYLPHERVKIQTAKWHPNAKVIGNVFAFDMSKPTHYMPLPAPPTPAGEGG